MKSSGTDLGLDAAKGYVPPIVKPPPVEEKKEKPAEETVHRKQFPDEYFCHICQAKCTSESQFESHNNGARHKKNLVAVEKGIKKAPVARPKSAGDGTKPTVVDTLQPSRCMDKLELMEEPLVGLDYITEFQNEDPDIEEHYMCSLCDSKCDPRTLNTHVIGARHRLAYLKEHHPDMAAMTLQNKKRSEQSVALAEFVKQAVKQDGQKEVKVKLELNPFYNPEQREKEKRKREEQHRRHAEATAAKRRRLGLTEDDDWGGASGYGPGRRGRHGPPMGRGRRRYPEDDDYYYPGGYADYGYPDEPYREGVSRGRGRGRMLPPAALRPRSPRSREAYYEGGYPEAPYEDDPHYGRDPYYHAERRREAYYRREVEGYEADPYGGGRPVPPDFRGPGGRGRGFDDFARHEQGPSHGPPADRSQLADLIGRAKDLVSSEDDAAMALQLSNALTKALLSYRLKNVPPELLKHAMGELGPNF